MFCFRERRMVRILGFCRDIQLKSYHLLESLHWCESLNLILQLQDSKLSNWQRTHWISLTLGTYATFWFPILLITFFNTNFRCLIWWSFLALQVQQTTTSFSSCCHKWNSLGLKERRFSRDPDVRVFKFVILKVAQVGGSLVEINNPAAKPYSWITFRSIILRWADHSWPGKAIAHNLSIIIIMICKSCSCLLWFAFSDWPLHQFKQREAVRWRLSLQIHSTIPEQLAIPTTTNLPQLPTFLSYAPCAISFISTNFMLVPFQSGAK